ncbi:hypothetical protein J3458_019985 [Metarhizium acridum]|uniref:Tat pathway signal sequence n=1 Tax=Metarhizium acridum (strain CQMa 102) TaxID=655827 RepID=E9EIF3_METAQ|nr:uncharacterized protein MAC_09651 [Metarhizium acridum CQMa 102]EFY84300.1 hypothetical protein MAC_09651 [Metarhizium acridum CQMa 102]KAG8408978.1 hypothetical protein J3458_019985 [Metarhizium acridum]
MFPTIGTTQRKGKALYKAVPQQSDENSRAPFQRAQRRRQISVLLHLLTFIVGLGLGLTATAPFLALSTPERKAQQLPSVIPAQVFTPPIPTAWVPDSRYIGFSNFSNIMWHRLIKTTESVWIANPSAHGLGPGFEAPFNHTSKSQLPPQFYHVSNLHQLHCLNVIRGRYFELQLHLSTLSKQSERAAQDTAYHMDHCIEYLRMTIMCGGNWVIEPNSPPGTPDELRRDPFDHPLGWGGIRQCVNWDSLMAWQKQQLDAYEGTF